MFPHLVQRSAARRFWSAALIGWLASWSAAGASGAEPPLGSDEGRPEVSWEDAGIVVGRVAFVSGTVIAVGHSQSMHFLNFDAERYGKFTAVVPAAQLGKFKPDLETLYAGKLVRVRGLVKTYREGPEIEVVDPGQIQVIEKAPAYRVPAPLRFDPQAEVRVATYNVLNLFDDVDDPDHADEGTPAKPKSEMERVAKTLREMDADVIALEEVENREQLQRFVDAFLIDVGYQVVLFEGNDVRGIDVALLSRLPVGDVTSHRHLTFPDAKGRPTQFRRDVLSVRIEPVGGDPFEVWVLHLHSNFEGREFAEPVRVGEARKVRSLLDQRLAAEPNARILVVGDFNDTWESDTLKAIVGDGGGAMRSFAEELPTETRITYNKEPYRSMIDFILATKGMAERYVTGSFRIVSGTEESGSDHNPVSARFKTGWKAPAKE